MRPSRYTLVLLTMTGCSSPTPPVADGAADAGVALVDSTVDSTRDSSPIAPDGPTGDAVAPADVTDRDGATDRDDGVPFDALEPVDATMAFDAPDSAAALDARSDVRVDSADVGDAAARDTSADSGPSPWISGPLSVSPLPPRSEQLPLPGAGQGPPVFTSNNPEVFQGDGLLFGTGRASMTRGGARLALARFGVYLHHLNRSGATKVVSLIVTNPNATPVTVSARGSGYNQTETGGLGLGSSPDFRVSDEWIQGRARTVVPSTTVAPSRPLLLWQNTVNNNAEVDGRFEVEASAPVLAYLVVTSTADLNEVVRLSTVDAPGIIARSGRPPPPFGREAGVYEFDTWRGSIRVDVPAAPTRARVGWMVNTATGSGHPQIQAFRALMAYDDSAQEAVGMYGNVYDLDVALRCSAGGAGTCRVRLVFLSHLTAMISRYWDGVGLVDGARVVVRHTPTSPSSTLGEYTLAAGASRTVRFRAMVPGLTSIPQALYAETF